MASFGSSENRREKLWHRLGLAGRLTSIITLTLVLIGIVAWKGERPIAWRRGRDAKDSRE